MGGTQTLDRTTFIHWADFIRVEDRSYLNTYAGAPYSPGSGRALADADLGLPFAQVQFTVADNIHDLPYEGKDGDAAFLAPGTVIYQVQGYAPTFRLAAWETYSGEQRLCLYEVDGDPAARRGADLLDIDGKVESIRILSAQDGLTEIGRIERPTEVQRLVGMVLSAPVDQEQHNHEGRQCFISFALLDGTAVTRMYFVDGCELSRGILVPGGFQSAVQEVLPLIARPEPH